MQTVVETPTYLAIARKLFDEEEREEIVTTVAFDPECGEVMAGTGGFRKVRVARAGMGKKEEGPALSIFGATTNSLSFSLRYFRKTRRET